MASSSISAGNPFSGHAVPKKLTRTNFLLWKGQILPVIRGARLEGYLTGATQAPSAVIDAKEGEATVKKSNPNLDCGRSAGVGVSSLNPIQGNFDSSHPHGNCGSSLEGNQRDAVLPVARAVSEHAPGASDDPEGRSQRLGLHQQNEDPRRRDDVRRQANG